MRLKHALSLGALLIPQLLQGQHGRPWQSTYYYRLTVVSNPQLAPDGRRVAFVVTTVVEDKDRRHNEIWLSPSDGSAAPFRYTSHSTGASSPTW
jgi:dipeptidyl aminopeptidase/acylaminoacyl peptidase